MRTPSRTPEGEPVSCRVCGYSARVEPSRPPGDAPCPACGSLNWFDPPAREPTPATPPAEDGLDSLERVERMLEAEERG